MDELRETTLREEALVNLAPFPVSLELVHSEDIEDDELIDEYWSLSALVNQDDRTGICMGIARWLRHYGYEDPRVDRASAEAVLERARNVLTLDDFFEYLEHESLPEERGPWWCASWLHLSILTELRQLSDVQRREWWALVGDQDADPFDMLDAIVAADA